MVYSQGIQRVSKGRCARVGQRIEYLLTIGGVVRAPLPIILLSPASPPRRLDKNQKGGVKSGRPGALKPGQLGLSGKASECSDGGTGDLGCANYSWNIIKRK